MNSPTKYFLILRSIIASQRLTIHSLQPLTDLADKIKTESDWLQRQAISGNLLPGGVVCCFYTKFELDYYYIFYVTNE